MATFRTSAAGGSTSGTGDRTVVVTPAIGDLFVVFCNVSVNTNATPTCSDNNGGTYTRIAAVLKNASGDTVSAFVRDQLLANTTSTTITVATGSNTAGAVHVLAIAGMSRTGANAVRSSGTQANQAAASTPAPALNQATLTGNVTVGCVGNGATAASMTAPTGWTERQDTGFSTPGTGLESVSRDSGFTGTTITWGSTSATAYASIALELDGSAVPVLASLDKTLGAATVAATGTVDVAGSTAATLGAATVAATGTVEDAGDPPVTGAVNATLGAATAAAAGAVAVAAGVARTLGAATVAATGTVEDARDPPVTGAVNATLGAATAAAAGAVAVAAGVARTLGAATVAATGTVADTGPVLASLAATLGAATVQGAGAVEVAAAADHTLGAATVAAAGTTGGAEPTAFAGRIEVRFGLTGPAITVRFEPAPPNVAVRFEVSEGDMFVGSDLVVRVSFTGSNGLPTDPGNPAVKITKPSGTATTYVYPGTLNRDAKGEYSITITLDEPAAWYVEASCDGRVKPERFYVGEVVTT